MKNTTERKQKAPKQGTTLERGINLDVRAGDHRAGG